MIIFHSHCESHDLSPTTCCSLAVCPQWSHTNTAERASCLALRSVCPTAHSSSGDPDCCTVLTSLRLSQVFLQVIGVIAVAAVIIPWILIPVAPLLAIFLYLRCYFLQTSRDIKRLESTSNLFFFLCGGLGLSICDKRQKQTTGMLIDHWRKPWPLA